MARKIDVAQAVRERYEDAEVQQAVLDDIARLGTEEKIAKGELVLPSEHDANIWHRRMTGREGMTEDQIKDHARLTALEQLVKELQEQKDTVSAQRVKALEKRIAELEGGQA